MYPGGNRHLLWIGFYIPDGRGKCSKYYKRTEIKDVPFWTTKSHFFKTHFYLEK